MKGQGAARLALRGKKKPGKEPEPKNNDTPGMLGGGGNKGSLTCRSKRKTEKKSKKKNLMFF